MKSRRCALRVSEQAERKRVREGESSSREFASFYDAQIEAGGNLLNKSKGVEI
jgi:hypothetical protein